MMNVVYVVYVERVFVPTQWAASHVPVNQALRLDPVKSVKVRTPLSCPSDVTSPQMILKKGLLFSFGTRHLAGYLTTLSDTCNFVFLVFFLTPQQIEV